MKFLVKLSVLAMLGSCLAGAGHAAVWDEMINGDPSENTGAWWYNSGTPTSVDLGGGNWALQMVNYGVKAELQRPNWSGPAQGITLTARFKNVVATSSQSLRLQVNDAQYGRLQMSWQSGTWTVTGAGSGSSWNMAADTWTTIWLSMEPVAHAYNLWVLDENTNQWALASQGNGKAAIDGADLRLGANDSSYAENWVDFLYVHHSGAFGPNDPNRPVVPEPSSLLAMASAVSGMGLLIRRRR